MRTHRPIDLLFPAYRRRVLGLLLVRPDESFHLREIARLTGVPAGSLHRELRALSQVGLLLREPLGNQVRYRADRSCPIYRELAEIFRKTVGLVDVLHDALVAAKLRVAYAFVFGSVARGDERPSSDVDLMVVGNAAFARVVDALTSVHDTLGRAVNPVVMKRTEFDAKRAAGDRFVIRVLKEPRLLVIGTESDLREPGPDRTTQESPPRR